MTEACPRWNQDHGSWWGSSSLAPRRLVAGPYERHDPHLFVDLQERLRRFYPWERRLRSSDRLFCWPKSSRRCCMVRSIACRQCNQTHSRIWKLDGAWSHEQSADRRICRSWPWPKTNPSGRRGLGSSSSAPSCPSTTAYSCSRQSIRKGLDVLLDRENGYLLPHGHDLFLSIEHLVIWIPSIEKFKGSVVLSATWD